LRRTREYVALRAAFARGREREGFRLVHYSVQNDHVHLIVEGNDRACITKGLRCLLIRIAKALNGVWGRRGGVFEDRYHDRLLRTPREVRSALVYVLNNGRKHGVASAHALDRCASGPWFDGWLEEIRIRGMEGIERPVASPRTWLLRVGWRRHGLIGFAEMPGGKRARKRRTRPSRLEGSDG
jgi:REP element-mobilizing transposase RayT